jgi:uncharacterized OsmC-like protein
MMEQLQLLKVQVQNEGGHSKIKRIAFENFPDVIRMGVHNGFSKFFGIEPQEPLPSTLDYVVAAVSACLVGTLSGALAKREVSAGPDKLTAEARGQLEVVDGKLLLTRISVHYRLRVPKEKRAAAERALQHHESFCPVSESVRRGITIDSTTEFEEE